MLTFTKYAKLTITVIGTILAILTEVTPLVPADSQHWVTGAILVLTLVARDLAEIIGGTSNVSAKAPSSTPSA